MRSRSAQSDWPLFGLIRVSLLCIRPQTTKTWGAHCANIFSEPSAHWHFVAAAAATTRLWALCWYALLAWTWLNERKSGRVLPAQNRKHAVPVFARIVRTAAHSYSRASTFSRAKLTPLRSLARRCPPSHHGSLFLIQTPLRFAPETIKTHCFGDLCVCVCLCVTGTSGQGMLQGANGRRRTVAKSERQP